MKKIRNICLIIVVLLVAIYSLVLVIDFAYIKLNKKPIFAKETYQYRDGGTKEYHGLGYRIIKCNTIIGDKSIHIGLNNLDVNKVCKH